MNRRSALARLGALLGAWPVRRIEASSDQAPMPREGVEDPGSGRGMAIVAAPVHTLAGIESVVAAVAFNEDGNRAVGGGEDGSLCVWDASDGRTIAKLARLEAPIVAVALSPDGSLVAASCPRYRTVHEAEGGGPRFMGGGIGPNGLPRAPGSGRTRTGRKGSNLKLYDVDGGREIRTLVEETSTLWAVAFGADGSLIGTYDVKRTFTTWRVQDGRKLASVGPEKDPADENIFPRGGSAFSRDAARVASIPPGADPIVVVSGLAGPRGTAFRCSTSLLTCVAMSRDGRRFAAADRDHQVTIRAFDTGVATGWCGVDPGNGPVGAPSALAFSPDGRWIASGSTDGVVRIWDIDRDRLLGTSADRDKRRVRCLAFADGGLRVIAGGDSHDGDPAPDRPKVNPLALWEVLF